MPSEAGASQELLALREVRISQWLIVARKELAVAFINGIAWNLLNVAIAVWLLMRSRGGRARQERHLAHA